MAATRTKTSKPGKPMALYLVTAGDRNADKTPEEKLAMAKRGENIGTDPIHHFYVVVEEDMASFGKAMSAVFHKFGAKTSDDLPRPFNMKRVDAETLLAQ